MKNLIMTVAAAATMFFAAEGVTAQETTGEVAQATTELQAPVEGYTKIEVSDLPVTVTKAVEEDKTGADVTEAWVDSENKTYKLTLSTEGAEPETAYINAAGEWIEPKE
ncbi:hypothetical protein [Leeuwenhoekiella marinoflava]|nr:hypothetical protein [Leeuwenhoekiella marinoflava]